MIEVVNGYPCFNCTDVANAKKGIDPARPNDAPNAIDTKTDGKTASAHSQEQAVTFGGNLSALNESTASGRIPSSQDGRGQVPNAPGSFVDLSA